MSNAYKLIKDEENGSVNRFKLFFQEGFFSSKFALWFLAVGLFINLAGWISIWIFIDQTAQKIILHYNVYFGVDIKDDPKKVYFLPLIALIIYLLNFLLAFYFYRKRERIATYILLIASLMVQFTVAISIASIILINY